MYKQLIKPLLFSISPEKAHHLVMGFLQVILAIPPLAWCIRKLYGGYNQPVTFFGLKFPNRVGLAAGFDKDGVLADSWYHLGFGFAELGTVTPLAQPGNPQPRLFRFPKDEAVLNRMGFNNKGALALAERLKRRKQPIIIGGNIGKNKDTANENAVDDYLKCFDALFPYVDYFTVNVSSPNTPGLRALQDKEPLLNILNQVMEKNKSRSVSKPILLKIAPDLTNEQLDDIVDIVRLSGIQGVIATNTTLSREGIQHSGKEVEEAGAGGISGKPLTKRSTEVIRYLHEKSKGAFPIIGAGGIHSPDDALEKLNAGASLVQLYSGYIYEGPALVKQINKAILKSYAKSAI